MTLLTMRTLVRAALNELSVINLSDSELNSIINDGYKDVSVKTLGYESLITKSNITANTRVVSLSADNVVRVNYAQYIDSAAAQSGLMNAVPTTFGHKVPDSTVPQWWFLWGTSLIVDPVPSVGTYDLYIFASCYPAAVLSSDSDTPSSLPKEFQDDIVLFAIAFAAIKLKRWADVALSYNRYITSVQRKRYEFIQKYPDMRANMELPGNVILEMANG